MIRNRLGFCCFVVNLTCHVAVAQQPTGPMPAAGTGIIAQMDKEILVAKKKAVDGLEKVLRDTTKRGDLAGAMAVKQTIDPLNGEIAAITGGNGARGVTPSPLQPWAFSADAIRPARRPEGPADEIAAR